MIGLELGPVVGQTGGGLEVVEQQITADGEVSIPAGWGSAYAGFRGEANIRVGPVIFGIGRDVYARDPGEIVDGFQIMVSSQSLPITGATGTLTFIRID